MAQVVAAFSGAARVVSKTGAGALTIDAAGGRLLATFLSPLTNRRNDEYGGPIENRMRFPLLIVEAVRAIWPRMLAVAVAVTEWHRKGIPFDDVVDLATALKNAGVDLIEVSAGGATPGAEPVYRRNYLLGLAAGLKHRAGLPVLVGGAISSLDDADTAIAAARADLIRLDPHAYQRRLTRPL
jgi:anthraniloyl-CoA monooxygenase